jgi:hypothetical protein
MSQIVLSKMMICPLTTKNLISEEKEEELVEELKKRRVGIEREDQHDGLYQISNMFRFICTTDFVCPIFSFIIQFV